MNVDSRVSVWRERIVIPTYQVGDPDPNPMFLENRVYQGSSGVVYPYPVINSIADEKSDVEWDAVFIENEYLKLMILPALGGRLQMALDKTNDYHFVYYNRVIKPALVGLAGPWISGGIEFNWPQHHRPNTYGPVDCHVVEDEDGSATVWCSEIDRMHGTQGTHGFRLRPGKAYVEIPVRLFNRTSEPQTFLWWANPACAAGDHHQSIFPPDVTAVMDHGKRATSSFPIATGEYYKVDYSPGTDISRYRNIPVPTSYMAHHSDYDFVGSYHHDKKAGLLHIADHHISPGKKQWTWGHGDFGQAWDRHLTDEDGPYIELMCGVYTDNQPDFSWLMPGEEKAFSQYFMPYKGVGQIKNATLRASLGLEVDGRNATIRVYTTSVEPHCRVTLKHQDHVLLDRTFDATPSDYFEAACDLDAGLDADQLHACVYDASGELMVAWRMQTQGASPAPVPAEAIPEPARLDTTEALFLAGTHIEQYRHATREAMDYYDEALRRDRTDIRNNIAKGKLLYRRGRFASSVRFFQRALNSLTRHNPNPYTGEAHYCLGLALRMLERYDEAFDAFHKSIWNAEYKAAGYFELARIASRRKDNTAALGFIEQCLDLNARHGQAIHLKVALLHETGKYQDADDHARRELDRNTFNYGVLYEQARRESTDQTLFPDLLRDDTNNYIELAIDYMAAGLYHRAVELLEYYNRRVSGGVPSPMVMYYLADCYSRLGQNESASAMYAEAATSDPGYCFPNKLSDIVVLSRAMCENPSDMHARYYLGNLWYDRRQYERAIWCWEKARTLDDSFATVHRNLGIAYFNKRHDREAAWSSYEKAFERNPGDPTVLAELDQLAKYLGHNPAVRLDRLDKHPDAVRQLDKLYLEWVALLNVCGMHDQALQTLLERRFHPWEGGEGKVPAQYVAATCELASLAISNADYAKALELLRMAVDWPQSLGEGKLAGARENNIDYLRGLAHQGLGEPAAAKACFTKAAQGQYQPTSAQYYNDQPPEMIYYQGLALQTLGRSDEARQRFMSLVEYDRQHADDPQVIDYFAVSLPDLLVFHADLQQKHLIHCRYMAALGHLGLGELKQAHEALCEVLKLDPAHLGAILHGSKLKKAVSIDHPSAIIKKPQRLTATNA